MGFETQASVIRDLPLSVALSQAHCTLTLSGFGSARKRPGPTAVWPMRIVGILCGDGTQPRAIGDLAFGSFAISLVWLRGQSLSCRLPRQGSVKIHPRRLRRPVYRSRLRPTGSNHAKHPVIALVTGEKTDRVCGRSGFAVAAVTALLPAHRRAVRVTLDLLVVPHRA